MECPAAQKATECSAPVLRVYSNDTHTSRRRVQVLIRVCIVVGAGGGLIGICRTGRWGGCWRVRSKRSTWMCSRIALLRIVNGLSEQCGAAVASGRSAVTRICPPADAGVCGAGVWRRAAGSPASARRSARTGRTYSGVGGLSYVAHSVSTALLRCVA